MPNKLAGSTSPYLLQHQNNPVHWYPWGAEALEKSRREGKPIFLSVGYAACHWCHVMEHESFEDLEIAAFLNEHFVSIKVDREQRPDLDHLYMQTVQMLTGSGGWPMSVFLTPDQKPFYGGTYWPPKRAMGRPGFSDVLRAIMDAWQNNREGIVRQSDEITLNLQAKKTGDNSQEEPFEQSLLWNADEWLAEVFDAKWGGFGGAPKFPHAMDLRLLMRLQSRRPNEHRLQRIVRTLDAMADGGIYDHLGGGFARYSTDEQWLVPHFEKMLYDNALLANTYLDGYLLTGDPRYRQVVCETLTYVLDDLTDPAGGFYCTRDADSEGIEGKYYVWTREEILDILGVERGNHFCEIFGVTFGGNFEGANILHHPEPLQVISERLGLTLADCMSQVAEDRKTLLQVRGQRVAPGLDDKVLCSWNALMISAMARAGAAFSRDDFTLSAIASAKFIQTAMTRPDGRLMHTWRDGKSEVDGFLEDYAYLAESLVTLFECTGDPAHLEQSLGLVNTMLEFFRDDAGGFFFTSSDSEGLIARYKDQHDASVPSGNAMAATAIVRLFQLTQDPRLAKMAEATFAQAASSMRKSPGGSGQMFIALDQYIGPSEELVYVSRDTSSRSTAIAHAFSKYRPRAVIVPAIANADGSHSLDSSRVSHLVEDRVKLEGSPIVLYQCSQGVCQLPRHWPFPSDL